MKYSDPNSIYWLAANYLQNIGPIRLRQWIGYFKNIKTIFEISALDLKNAGMTDAQIQAIKNINWKKIENDIRWCEQHHCHLLTWDDEDYPKLLREISAAPPLLYVRGDFQLLHQAQLAIVGSRNPTATGLETAKQFAYALTQAGLIVTSGLASGIDAAAHQGALSANGKTIAVMGTGLKHIYPRSNRQLSNQVIAAGALVSEFPLETLAKAQHFPRRNRIISGLSLGVLVVEAALKSGSLITARFAADQGRDVFAIPGSIHHSLAKGCHYLIRQGAKLVESIEDILLELSVLQDNQAGRASLPVVSSRKTSEELDQTHQHLLVQIGYEMTPLDTIVLRSGLTIDEVSSMLLFLELKGYINTVSGGYIRN